LERIRHAVTLLHRLQGIHAMQRKPNIILSSLDMERIEALLEKQTTPFPGRDALEAELDRADVFDPKDMPPNVVTMNSTVRFTLLESGKSNTLTLVYPKEMDGSGDKVSVFAPVGIALLGLSVGDEFQMSSPTGQVTVRVDAIEFQPENAGELHR
jgi:regulator of nucleoside diphosphate kinase